MNEGCRGGGVSVVEESGNESGHSFNNEAVNRSP